VRKQRSIAQKRQVKIVRGGVWWYNIVMGVTLVSTWITRLEGHAEWVATFVKQVLQIIDAKNLFKKTVAANDSFAYAVQAA